MSPRSTHPMSPTRSKHDTLPVVPIPRSNTYEIPGDVTPTQTRDGDSSEVESHVEMREGVRQDRHEVVATVYDVPIDANGKMEDEDIARSMLLSIPPPSQAHQQPESGAYDTPIDAMKTREGREAVAMPTHSCEQSWNHQMDESGMCEGLTDSESASPTESESMLRQESVASTPRIGTRFNTCPINGVSVEDGGGVCTIDDDKEYIPMASALIYVNRRAHCD